MRVGAAYFLEPSEPAQRRYEAMRAYFVDGLTAGEVAERFGYSPASITLPNNQTTPGVVSSVATVATCPSSAGAGGSGSSSATAGRDTCSSGSTPTITVNVTPSDPGATGRWDQAPVQVGITTASVRDALVVPVTALLSKSGGGYCVEIAGAHVGTDNRLVSVSLGLFDDADGLVQVTGPGLAAGQEVVVPST